MIESQHVIVKRGPYTRDRVKKSRLKIMTDFYDLACACQPNLSKTVAAQEMKILIETIEEKQ